MTRRDDTPGADGRARQPARSGATFAPLAGPCGEARNHAGAVSRTIAPAQLGPPCETVRERDQPMDAQLHPDSHPQPRPVCVRCGSTRQASMFRIDHLDGTPYRPVTHVCGPCVQYLAHQDHVDRVVDALVAERFGGRDD